MADWSIKIITGESDKQGSALVPNIGGYEPGDPLPAEQDDLVSWNNTTDETHQPWPTDSQYNPLSEAVVMPRGSVNYLSDPIPPGESSTPAYDVALPNPPPANGAWTVYYYCKLHPDRKTEWAMINATLQPS